jgi:predicted flavoprotein YhiN
MIDALIIGGGPAGLMAADVLSAAGHSVTITDSMQTVGRKFLMAGKSGLNLTKVEDFTAFQTAYGASNATLKPTLSAFGPDDVSAWAQGLGQTVFTGTTGRVFPTKMKSSPLLRAC